MTVYLTEAEDLAFQAKNALPDLGSDIKRDGDRVETVIEATIKAQTLHYFDPRLNTADRSIAVRRVVLDLVRLSLVHAGLSFEETTWLPILKRVQAAMIERGYIFEGKGVCAI